MNERYPTREKLRRRETFRGSGLGGCGEGDHQPTEDKLARSRGCRKGSARQQCSSSASFESTEAEQRLQRITMIATTQQNMTTELVCVHLLLFCPHFFFSFLSFQIQSTCMCVREGGCFVMCSEELVFLPFRPFTLFFVNIHHLDRLDSVHCGAGWGNVRSLSLLHCLSVPCRLFQQNICTRNNAHSSNSQT